MTRKDKIKNIVYNIRKKDRMCLPIPIEQLIMEIKQYKWTTYEQKKINRILKGRYNIKVDFNN